ncbi:hypothetical protein A1O3_01525 [Capronia epimyces CBS 606.96]|uniref:FAD dependent oxidoreductase domain-containing protein n=1 Tax=Capronia epimyces CBS 606.96 TaxID=1182542 RepID=W9ZEP1_9EURO|nr:uncharacterized protein A1O3_01525 [Capronia epimyces CBS 606.96]EXJ92969.1 hypothetical protein A1O3_01525 [Capronia epimyces CBS 606.96]
MAQPLSRAPSKDDKILIVGAGVFGLSTAFELRTRGYENITVLDRMMPPVPDGSSVDVSRVIRYDYADPFYGKLATEAMHEWTSDAWTGLYHGSGFVMSSQTPNEPYIEKCKTVLKSQQQPFTSFENVSELFLKYPALKGGLNQSSGYINTSGGWADAAGSIQRLAGRCSELGVSFIVGPRGTVRRLRVDRSRVVGVETTTGSIDGTTVILATGAWTNKLTDVSAAMSSSGQPVGFIQLSPEESRSLSQMPVLIDLTSGCFVFPPTPDTHLLKIARHSHGFQAEHETKDGRIVSTPKLSNGATSSFLPSDADAGLREGLRFILPQFANYPWKRRRLCWYTDTPEGNFVVDFHPKIDGLFIAAGGAGHAFKFLPVLGRHIADCFENKASAETRTKWKLPAQLSASEPIVCNDGSRRGPPRRKLSRSEQARL